ncbi:thiosulfate oxidation carrier complex protein SoxZ [Methylibium sp.]|uniref:thiosulfate oxidation carrier complex protein SoxZ n=1 Tax=Methylibium sp. TaxID=2067992 RepID=UPI0039C9E0B1
MPSRRDLLLSLSSFALPWAGARADDVAGFRRAAFDAKTLPQAIKALGLQAPQPSKDVQLTAPDLFEDGSVVPITFGCALPGVKALLVGVERNPTWLAAWFEPGDAIEPSFGVRLKMQETSPVAALVVMADGRVLTASKEVKITLGGCGGAAEPVSSTKVEPTLIRLSPGAKALTVRALMKHEMESGQRKDSAGQTVPAWHIQQVVARLNGQPVLNAQWGTAVAKNPFLQFALRGAKAGDRLALAWADNRGATRADEVAVAAA